MTLLPRIRLGTRASALARWQADWVAQRLAQSGARVELVPISTSGDRQAEGAIGALGDKGVFTKEIQRALLDETVDLAVHSLKDLPTDPIPGLVLAAVPERGAVGDVLVSPKYGSLAELPQAGTVGTGSLRRRAQLLHLRPDLRVQDIRGNVETRLGKVDRGDFDAIVLAEAGLCRLGLGERITQAIPQSLVLPAVGQGALGLETRAGDGVVRDIVQSLNHPATRAAVEAERAMLAALSGGCLAPIAAWGRVEGGRLVLTGRVLGADGSRVLESTLDALLADAESLGRRVAERLLSDGAAELIEACRKPT